MSKSVDSGYICIIGICIIFNKLPDFIFKPKSFKGDIQDEYGKQIMNNMLSLLLAFWREKYYQDIKHL